MLRSGKSIAVILVLVAIVSIAYGYSTLTGEPKLVSGQIVDVQSASVTTISTLTLEDDSGKQWVFQGAGPFSGFTPSHLEEHRALWESVTVEYKISENGELVIVGMTD
jgi:hypothetical protein